MTDKEELILNQIMKHKPGTFTTIDYVSMFTKGGKVYSCIKHCVVRFGINYGHLRDILLRGVLADSSNTEWIVKNYLERTSKGKSVIWCYTTNNVTHNKSDNFTCDDEPISREEFYEMKGKSSNPTKLFKLDIEKIVRIGE